MRKLLAGAVLAAAFAVPSGASAAATAPAPCTLDPVQCVEDFCNAALSNCPLSDPARICELVLRDCPIDDVVRLCQQALDNCPLSSSRAW